MCSGEEKKNDMFLKLKQVIILKRLLFCLLKKKVKDLS